MKPIRMTRKLIQKSLNQFGFQIVRRPEALFRGVTVEWLDHFRYLEEMYDRIKGVEGAVVECGVGRGDSLFKLCYLVMSNSKPRKIFGFDSFQGFPQPSEQDRSPRNPQKGEWDLSSAHGIYELLTESCELPKRFVDDNLTLIEGFFDESLPKCNVGPVALLHLDVDLYASYKVTLEYFWPKVAIGGIVLFDEYKNAAESFPGAQKAIDEFFGSRVTEMRFHERANRYYIVKTA